MRDNFSNILDYSKYFKELVELERKEEQRFYLKEINNLSAQRREKLGRAITNLNASYKGRGLRNSTLVKFGRVEKFGNLEISVGDLVIATTLKKPTGQEKTGTVVEITNRSITINYLDNPPNNLFKSKNIRIDLFTNDITYSRMLTALSKVQANNNLKRILLGRELKKINEGEYFKIANKNLNETQIEAVSKSLRCEDIYFLHGPPGTGKTTTLVESIVQHSLRGEKVLVCADSNTAVDNLVEKLLRYTSSLIRIGNPAKVNDEILEQTLDYRLNEVDNFKDAKALYDEIDKIRTKQAEGTYPSKDLKRGLSDAQIKKYARARRGARGVPIGLMKKMGAWLYHQEKISYLVQKAKVLEKLAIEEVLDENPIIVSTNVNAGSDLLVDFLQTTKTKFDVCFVDEATQSVEPSTLIPGLLAPKLILAGDHKQLPPTVLSMDAKPLSYSLFERLIKLYNYSNYTQLKIQYRMNKQIMKFSNEKFYDNSLKAHKSNENIKLKLGNNNKQLKNDFLLQDKIVNFVNVSSTNDLEEKQSESFSYFNTQEIKKVVSIVEDLVSDKFSIHPRDIGIISPYLAQVKQIRLNLDNELIEVKSIDGFQGREKDVIIISLVRSNEKGQIGFLSDERRLNVALTRAKRKLIIIGDKKTLQKSKMYKDLIKSISS